MAAGLSLTDLAQQTSSWMQGKGPEAQTILSSRVRLARNLQATSFPHRASPETLQRVMDQVKYAGQQSSSLKRGIFLTMGELATMDRIFLLERHLVSHELANAQRTCGLLLENQEGLSVMVNEEDHLRIQAIVSGFQLEEAHRAVDRLDDELESSLDYAFSEDWGYLTACPTNVGTGLRASVLMHLPALVLTQRIEQTLRNIGQVGFMARGLYGEGTEVMGSFFQISNQATLGRPEEEIIEGLVGLTGQILRQEEEARSALMASAQAEVEDKIWRAYGILKYARQISSEDVMNLLSAVRLGIALGLITNLSIRTVNEVLILTQPAHLQKRLGRNLGQTERDGERAKFVRERFSG